MIRTAFDLFHAVTVFVGKVLCDAPTLESRAFGEGFTQGEHVTYDRVAHYLHTPPEEQ